jgi:hypothetical protein
MRGRTVDLVLAGSGLAVGALMFVTGQYQARADARWLFGPLVVCCAALLLRRTAPLASVLVGTVAVAADVAIGPSLATPLVYTQVLYDACVHGRAALARALLVASGLIGMRERAALLGGDVDAGPTRDRFLVQAWLPYTLGEEGA